MEASTETPKKPEWKKAQDWNNYFKPEDGKKNVSIENSTGYQLYAVNEQTIASGVSISFGELTTDEKLVSDTLNLQFADAVYKGKATNFDSFDKNDFRGDILFRKTSQTSNISKSFLMTNGDFKFNMTIGQNLEKNLNIQSIVINEYQQQQRVFIGSMYDGLFKIIGGLAKWAGLGALNQAFTNVVNLSLSILDKQLQVGTTNNTKNYQLSNMTTFQNTKNDTYGDFTYLVGQLNSALGPNAQQVNAKLLKSLADIGNAAVDVATAIPGVNTAKGAFKKMVNQVLPADANKTGTEALLQLLKIDKLIEQISQQNPIKQLYKFFTHGKWLNTYEVPYLPGSADILYLKSNNASKWDVNAGMQKLMGKTLAGALTENTYMQYPVTPIFESGDNAANLFETVTTTFYLINDSTTNLAKNFKFLHSLFAGTQWILLKFGYRRAPNVYNVYCNSRFNYIWASIDMTVNSCGKVYKNPKISNEFKEKYKFKYLNNDTLWPTAWQVTLSIRSLVPNNYNTYLEFIYNGFNANTVINLTSRADSKNTAAETAVNGLVGGVANTINAAAGALRDLATWMKRKLIITKIIFLNTRFAIILYVQAYFVELIYEYFLLIKSVIVF